MGFRIGDRVLRAAQDFAPGQLTSPHHTKNILAYAFEQAGVHVICSFLQLDEHALAARVELEETSGQEQSIAMAAFHTYQLGGQDWWGRDGLAGNFDEDSGALWIRSFAAGTAFAVAANQPSDAHFFSNQNPDRDTWLGPGPKSGVKLAYYPQPLHGGLRYHVELAPRTRREFTFVMARADNLPWQSNGRASRRRKSPALSLRNAPRTLHSGTLLRG